jgi:hypothetical protein
MANEARAHNEFEATTQVMESGLLRVLTDKTSDTDEAEPASRDDMMPPIKIACEPPIAEAGVEDVTTPAQPDVVANEVEAPEPPPPLAVEASAPPAPAKRRSRVFVVAGIVAAVVLAFDASLLLLHQRRAMRSPASATSEPLPKYMILPLDTPPPTAPSAAVQAAATPAPAPTAVAPVQVAIAPAPATAPAPIVATAMPAAPATAMPAAPASANDSHRHSRHRHASH